MSRIGRVREVVRYPVKSMAGVSAESAVLGWHGFPGDRRFAFRRLDSDGDFPWLTASRLPELILYRPLGLDENAEDPSPERVRTPDGGELALRSPELLESVAARYGNALELMRFKHGIFDDATISVIALATVGAICSEAGKNADTRRFRANVVVDTDAAPPFSEDGWIGRRLRFGSDEGAIVSLTARDVRCMMINLDPDTAKQDPGIMKAVVRMNDNNAGAYGTVVRAGRVTVGQEVTLLP